jgi:hypothetical protein
MIHWCKRELAGDDGEMRRFVPIEDLFKGRHFEGRIWRWKSSARLRTKS